MGPERPPRETLSAYTHRARHFDAEHLPPMLQKYLLPGPLSLADVGCGDGPLFAALEREGFISPDRTVYAVDVDAERLGRVSIRFPYIEPICAPADAMTVIPSGSLDFVVATMVMEHVPDEEAFLDEIRRLMRTGGRAYLTTVFKRRWAWYFRRRGNETVLDPSHLREYTDLEAFRSLLGVGRRFSTLLDLAIRPLWFQVADPLLFRIAGHIDLAAWSGVLAVMRSVKVPIPGYYTMYAVLEA